MAVYGTYTGFKVAQNYSLIFQENQFDPRQHIPTAIL